MPARGQFWRSALDFDAGRLGIGKDVELFHAYPNSPNTRIDKTDFGYSLSEGLRKPDVTSLYYATHARGDRLVINYTCELIRSWAIVGY